VFQPPLLKHLLGGEIIHKVEWSLVRVIE
jgi:hypothetical protein